MASSASSDEGEISEVGLDKATTSLPQYDGPSVDRTDRPRSRYSNSPAPEHGASSYSRRSSDRSRSPYSERHSRGAKRSRDDDHYDRPSRDPRRFKVHYEDDSSFSSRRQARGPYKDLDRPGSNARLRYDDPPIYPDKNHRKRSRSPYRRSGKENARGGREGHRREGSRHGSYADAEKDRSNGYDDRHERASTDQSVSKGGQDPTRTDLLKWEAKHDQGYPHKYDETNGSLQPLKSSNAEEDVSLQAAAPETEPLDENAIIEARRRKREAIKAAVKAKYRGASTPTAVQALSLDDKPGDLDLNGDGQSTRSESPLTPMVQTPKESQGPSSPRALAVTDDKDLANKFVGDSAMPIEEDGPSAADYDPTMDMREDRRRDDKRHGDVVSSGAHDENNQKLNEQDICLPTTEEVSPDSKKDKDEFDMFADEDDDDMFAPLPEAKVEKGKEKIPAGPPEAIPIPAVNPLGIGMLDNWDDSEGYYKVILGELLDGRYHIQTNLGRGMFAAVVRATDISTKKVVAIKIIRNNDTMRKAGSKEIEILEKLNEADPGDKKHIVRLERHFEHKGHLCMVFENLSLNLREVLKKFGRDVGINIGAIRHYAYQMFLGLSLMKKSNILHADLKPDNILVSENRNLLKICDLGSASDTSENEITPYLVSRFYRAPEIILGMPYDCAIDVWSIGCTLYELYTGKILFTGRSNNQMLRSIMECRGKFTTKMLKKSQFAGMHFDEMMNFRSVEQDKLTGKDVVKMLSITRPIRDLRTRLVSVSRGLTDVETKELNLFIDLIDRCLALNPEKRCTPSEALKHPFILRATAVPGK